MNNINKILKEFARKLPKFPDGRIDYSNSDTALVLKKKKNRNSQFSFSKKETKSGQSLLFIGYRNHLLPPILLKKENKK